MKEKNIHGDEAEEKEGFLWILLSLSEDFLSFVVLPFLVTASSRMNCNRFFVCSCFASSSLFLPEKEVWGGRLVSLSLGDEDIQTPAVKPGDSPATCLQVQPSVCLST